MLYKTVKVGVVGGGVVIGGWYSKIMPHVEVNALIQNDSVAFKYQP